MLNVHTALAADILCIAIALTRIYLSLHAAMAITTLSAMLTTREVGPLDGGCCPVQLTLYPSSSSKAILDKL